jgi:hypothetical protein
MKYLVEEFLYFKYLSIMIKKAKVALPVSAENYSFG